MPGGLFGDLQRAIWERDGHRCRDCGIVLGGDGGGFPQTHRIVPRALSGTDDPRNLVTLCFPCHATRGLRTYVERLRAAAPDRLPEFVKQMTRDYGRNLIAYSELIDPTRFNPAQAGEEFGLWRLYLDILAGLAGDAPAKYTVGVGTKSRLRAGNR
jgi:hypothetical protein